MCTLIFTVLNEIICAIQKVPSRYGSARLRDITAYSKSVRHTERKRERGREREVKSRSKNVIKFPQIFYLLNENFILTVLSRKLKFASIIKDSNA